MTKMKCPKCEDLKLKLAKSESYYNKQVEWYKEEKKQKEELRLKLNELLKEHDRILKLYFR